MAKLNDTQINGDLKVTGSVDAPLDKMLCPEWKKVTVGGVYSRPEPYVGAPFLLINDTVYQLSLRYENGGYYLTLTNMEYYE